MVLTKMTFAVILCLFFVSSLSIVYFMKKKINNDENRIYKFLIVGNLFGLVLHILCDNVSYYYNSLPGVVSTPILKFLLIYYFLFGLFILDYLITIINSKNKKIYVLILRIICVISILTIFALPQNIVINKENMIFYTNGLDTKFVFLISGIEVLTMFIIIIAKFKTINKKKIIPLIIFSIFAVFSTIVQNRYPDIVFTDCVESIIILLMYFTIENPDVRMIEQLNIARDQAEKANNAKSDFLSSMSHEIRTPLNAIVGFSQALSEEDLPYQAKEEVKDIMMASETLLDIVNGILDISKIEANKLEIVNTEYNFNTVLEELVSLSKARIGEKPLDFRYSFSPDIPKYMLGDKVRVKQVILNLLTNAIKYTHEGWIEFKVNCVNRDDVCRLIISVQDTGIGIKQESINKLFNRFERLDVEKNNTIEGTGLGLAITKKLIELMGGQIVVQSVYGEGSKFTVALDQKIVTNPTNPSLERTQVLDLSAINNIDLTNKRILIVDDNKINLKVASRLLQDYHCIVDTLDSGIACCEKIGMGASYDLILMDDMMPKQSGVETFHKLQEIEGFNTPVIALTANAISGMKEKYLSEGFSDYLSKPIDKTELNKVLNKFLN